MQRLFLLVFIPWLALTGCRDREETALLRLQKRGYGFVIGDFHRAASEGDLKAVEDFLEAGMSANVEAADGNTAFRNAIDHRRDHVALALLDAGVTPDQRLGNGRTALIEVATRTGDDLQLLDTLLRKGANPRAIDANGMTAMMAASLGGHVDAVRRLVNRDVRSLDKALMLASATGHTHCMDVVIARGAYVNCRSHDTRTPLMLAAAKGHQQAVALLLQHQANRFETDSSGKTAADWATANGHTALAATLNDISALRWAPDRAVRRHRDSPLDEPLPSINGQAITITLAANAQVNETRPTAPPSREPLRPVLDPPTENAADVPPSSLPTPTRSEPVDLRRELKLGRFQERFIPMLLTEVNENRASVRVLTQPSGQQIATVSPGEVIPGTSLRVSKLTKRSRTAKGGRGEIDVSEMLAEDMATGTSERFVVDSLSSSPDSHLIVAAGEAPQMFAVRRNDMFSIAETGQQFQVVAIRPHQLLVRDLQEDSVLTIQRE